MEPTFQSGENVPFQNENFLSALHDSGTPASQVLEENRGRKTLITSGKEIALDVAVGENRQKLKAIDCKSFLTRCGVATSGPNGSAALMISRAVVMGQLCLSLLSDENNRDLFATRITHSVIPAVLRSHLSRQESLGEQESLIAAAKSFPKMRSSNIDARIFVEGFIGSTTIPGDENVMQADAEAVSVWKTNVPPRTPLSPTSQRQVMKKKCEVPNAQLTNYLQVNGLKTTGTQVELEARVRNPSVVIERRLPRRNLLRS